VSVLSDRDIKKEANLGSLDLGHPDTPGVPLAEVWRIQPASVEVTLNANTGSLLGYDSLQLRPIDPESPPRMVEKQWRLDPTKHRRYYRMRPGEFLLGSTAEELTLGSGMCAAIEGKSSLGRLGLMIHCTARFVDPGWKGRLTLEFYNAAPLPLILWGGMRVGQIRFERLSSPSERPYGTESLGSHYQGSLTTLQAASVVPRPLDEVAFARERLGNWIAGPEGAPQPPA
jgi:dCTP deaminase